MKFKVLDIIRGTTVDGPGFRTSIYLSGCRHHCHGCHNPQSWDENSGREMSLEEIMDIVDEEDFNVTITGGDPLFNPESLKCLLKALKAHHRNVWVYTGYTWEEICGSQDLFSAIRNADIIVDGRYDETLKDLDLFFRGSSNQRIIDVNESIKQGAVVIYNHS